MTKSFLILKQPSIKKALDDLFVEYPLAGKTESLKIGVLYKNRVCEYSFGKKFDYFDLASLTKVIFTLGAIYNYEVNLETIIDRKVKDILPWFRASNTIKVSDLLAHQSGAPALYPVFNTLKHSTLSGLEPLNLILRDIPFEEKSVVYSDVGFFVLGAILEVLYQKPLYLIFEHLRNVFPMGGLHFNPIGERSKYAVSKYAPTENCPLRKKIIQSEVHDENCWRMGGVAPHAGLFGQLKDVLVWLNDFESKMSIKHSKNSKVAKRFLKKQKGDWRLGLMLPSRPESSCGQFFSDHSWGHLGFTGTSFWVDPEVDLSVVILSNRTYPNRDNKGFNVLRPLIHDTIYTSIMETAT